MRALLAAICLAGTMTLGVSGARGDSSWPMQGHDAANTAFNPGEHVLGIHTVRHLHRAWIYRRPLTALIVVGRHVYGVLPAGVVVLDARTGKRLRLFTTKSLGVSPGLMATGLAYAHGVLAFVSSQAMVVLRPSNGKVLWRRPLTRTTNLSIAGTVVYTGSYCFNGCPTDALDLFSGKQLWENPTGGLIQSIVGNRLFEGLLWHGFCQDRIFDIHTGALVATLSSCGGWTGNASHTYGIVFPSDTNQPASVEPVQADGTPGRWRVDVGRPESTALVFAGGTLFAPTEDPSAGVVAVRARDGRVLWRRAVRGPFHILAANRLLFILHHGGSIDAVRTGNGSLVRHFRVPGAGSQAPLFGGLVAGGQLYVSVGKTTVVMRP